MSLGKGLLLSALLLASPAAATIIPLVASFDEAQVVPPSGSLAFGTGVFSLDDVLGTLQFSIVVTDVLLTGPEILSQLHFGVAGVNGAAFADLPSGALKTGTLDLSLLAACTADVSACVTTIATGGVYALVSSEGDPEGAVRGQLVPVVVPEPMIAMLLGVGLLGLASWRRLWLPRT